MTTSHTAATITDKVVCTVTNNGRNIVSAIQINNMETIPCFAHTFNLIVQGSIAADTTVNTLQKKCKVIIVSCFHRSINATDQLSSIPTSIKFITSTTHPRCRDKVEFYLLHLSENDRAT